MVTINLPPLPINRLDSVPSIADLRAFPSMTLENGADISVDGTSDVGDGGGGLYTWSELSVQADNGSSVIRPNDVPPLSAGRWIAVGTTALNSALTITGQFTYSDNILHSQTRMSFGMENVLTTLWGGGFENNTRFFVGNPIGRAAIVGFTRSSDNPTAGDMGTYALGAFVEHNSDKYAWAGYDEIRRRAGAGAAHGREISMVNYGSVVDTDPYNAYAPNLTDCLRPSVGRLDTPGQVNISAFAHFVPVGGAKALKGIVFGTGGVVSNSGQQDVICMSIGDALTWWVSPGVRGPHIRSDATNGAQSLNVVFGNNVISFQDASNSNRGTITPTRIEGIQYIKPGSFTFAQLSALTGMQDGDRATLVDSSTTTFYASAAGGGSSVVPVIYAGGAWRIG